MVNVKENNLTGDIFELKPIRNFECMTPFNYKKVMEWGFEDAGDFDFMST